MASEADARIVEVAARHCEQRRPGDRHVACIGLVRPEAERADFGAEAVTCRRVDRLTAAALVQRHGIAYFAQQLELEGAQRRVVAQLRESAQQLEIPVEQPLVRIRTGQQPDQSSFA